MKAAPQNSQRAMWPPSRLRHQVNVRSTIATIRCNHAAIGKRPARSTMSRMVDHRTSRSSTLRPSPTEMKMNVVSPARAELKNPPPPAPGTRKSTPCSRRSSVELSLGQEPSLSRSCSPFATADSCNRRPAGEAGHQSMSKLSLRRTRKISSESVCRPQLEGVFKLFEPNIRSCRFEMGTCCVEAGVARPQRPPKKIRHPKKLSA